MRHHNHLDFRRPSELDNPDNRVLLAFFFIFSDMWVAEFLPYRFRRAQGKGGELAGTTGFNTRKKHLILAQVSNSPWTSWKRE